MFFHHNIDVNIKFRYSLIIIDLQMDEKHHSRSIIDDSRGIINNMFTVQATGKAIASHPQMCC